MAEDKKKLGLVELLQAASHALRSYQYGNSAAYTAESMADAIDVALADPSLRDSVFMPASFICDKCGFQLEKRTISASTGQIGICKEGYDPEPCPKDGEMLRRLTWREAFEDAARSRNELMLALIESVQLQSHYANLLNMHDGGQRMQFSSVAAWIERLKEAGTIPKEPQ